MSQMTPEFALGYRAAMLASFKNEAEITKKVIAAIPDAKSDYRPDPQARTAKELAWHIANSDIQFLDGIADLKFNMETAEHKPETSAEVVAWYDENVKRAVARVEAMTGEQLSTPVSFFGVFNFPAVAYLGFLAVAVFDLQLLDEVDLGPVLALADVAARLYCLFEC